METKWALSVLCHYLLYYWVSITDILTCKRYSNGVASSGRANFTYFIHLFINIVNCCKILCSTLYTQVFFQFLCKVTSNYGWQINMAEQKKLLCEI